MPTDASGANTPFWYPLTGHVRYELLTWHELKTRYPDDPQALNSAYNESIHTMDGAADDIGYWCDKILPYMGWFWRDTNFAGNDVLISTDGSYTAVDEAQKWGYPTRQMTPAETEVFIIYIDNLIKAVRGTSKDRVRKMHERIRQWMSLLEIPINPEHPLTLAEKLTDDEHELIRVLMRAGETARAQRVILDALGPVLDSPDTD